MYVIINMHTDTLIKRKVIFVNNILESAPLASPVA